MRFEKSYLPRFVCAVTAALLIWHSANHPQDAWAGRSNCAIQVISREDEMLATGGDPMWCRVNQDCTGDPDVDDCADAQPSDCEDVGEPCTEPWGVPQHPESCMQVYGNEHCPVDPGLVRVECAYIYTCQCEDDNGTLSCTQVTQTGLLCEQMRTAVGCIYVPCPQP